MTYYSRYRPCRLSLQKRAQSHSSCSGGWSGANSIIVTYSPFTLKTFHLLYSTILSSVLYFQEITSALFSLTETFWFRPLTIFFRLEGIIYYIRGREDWGQLHRRRLSKKQRGWDISISFFAYGKSPY